MKTPTFGSFLLALFLCVALTACGTETPTPSPQESETTTTTSTTTTTTTTSSVTTTTTAEASVTTPSKTSATASETKTPTTKTETPTASQTTVPKGDPNYCKNPPYEDKSAAPGKDKRCLIFTMNGEEVEFAFEKAMRDPFYDDELLWHYSGTTKAGVPVTCIVAAEQNALYEVKCNTEYDFTIIKEADARACVKQFLKDQNLSVSLDEVKLQKDQFMTKGDTPKDVVFWNISLPTSQDNDYIQCSIRSKDGKAYLHTITVGYSETIEGQVTTLPYLLGKSPSWLVPRWKSQ